MEVAFLSLLTGIFVGCLFSVSSLPIPAPPTVAGILGIVGVYVGFVVVNYLKAVING